MACYLAAFAWPQPGIALRSTTFLAAPLSFPLLFLLLLLGALGVDAKGLQAILRYRGLLLTGLLALWLGPLPWLLVLNWSASWSAATVPSGVMAGLGLVAFMPSAASSVGWSQLSRGNPAVSLGMVVGSTLLSPLVIGLSRTTPIDAGAIDAGEIGRGVGWLMAWIVPAVLLGMLIRRCLDRQGVSMHAPSKTLATAAIVLLLNYMNAAVALPHLRGNVSASALTATVLLTAVICCLGFASGWAVSRGFRTEPGADHAVVYGVGMKNTGMALVLAGVWLESLPLATLAIISYTLLQHLAAAGYQGWAARADAASSG